MRVTCDRCGESMDQAEAVTARRKSGADALLCPDCAAIVRGWAAVKPPQNRISQNGGVLGGHWLPLFVGADFLWNSYRAIDTVPSGPREIIC